MRRFLYIFNQSKYVTTTRLAECKTGDFRLAKTDFLPSICYCWFKIIKFKIFSVWTESDYQDYKSVSKENNKSYNDIIEDIQSKSKLFKPALNK